jgi:hypothetical protein
MLGLRRAGVWPSRQETVLMQRTKGEEGQSLLEIAVAFPLFVLVIMAIGAVAWTFWVQAATAIASQEAARHSAYRVRDTFDPTAGFGPFSEAMAGITGSTSASYIGNPEIVVDPVTRSVQVTVSRGATFRTPATSADYTFRSGTFSRIMQFFGGPPDPWE